MFFDVSPVFLLLRLRGAYLPGNPHLDFERGMELEHCYKNGCDFEFETSNYHIKTTPSKEWKIVVQRDLKLAERDMRHNRRIPDLDTLMSEPCVVRAKLGKCEVLATVLYTGPLVR
jgi:hypothetical protein